MYVYRNFLLLTGKKKLFGPHFFCAGDATTYTTAAHNLVG